MAHRDAVGDGDGAKLARRAAGHRDALLGGLGLAHQRDVAGRGFVPAGGDADERLMDLRCGQTHRVIIRAMRSAVGTLGDVPAGQPVLQLGLGIHRRTGRFLGRITWSTWAPARPPPSPRGKSLADYHSALLLSDPVEKTGNVTTAWGSIDLGEWYGQIAARGCARSAMVQMFQGCCRRATGGRTAISANAIAKPQTPVLRPQRP